MKRFISIKPMRMIAALVLSPIPIPSTNPAPSATTYTKWPKSARKLEFIKHSVRAYFKTAYIFECAADLHGLNVRYHRYLERRGIEEFVEQLTVFFHPITDGCFTKVAVCYLQILIIGHRKEKNVDERRPQHTSLAMFAPINTLTSIPPRSFLRISEIKCISSSSK